MRAFRRAARSSNDGNHARQEDGGGSSDIDVRLWAMRSSDDPFGRGWTTAGITIVCIVLLVVARTAGAGAYGIGAVPFLLGLFVATGVIAGRAVGSVVRRVWRAGAWLFGVPTGVASSVVQAAVWNTTPSESRLLVRLFAVTAAASVAWALASNRRARWGAWTTAAVTLVFLAIALAANL